MQTKLITLTDDQVKSLEALGQNPLRVINPRTSEAFVLVSEKEFERLKNGNYDDNPLSREELEQVAWAISGEEEWPEYEVDTRET
jgi:PHD/YefM family antitoxin component YafN of YafNO toxin-antitoxin module